MHHRQATTVSTLRGRVTVVPCPTKVGGEGASELEFLPATSDASMDIFDDDFGTAGTGRYGGATLPTSSSSPAWALADTFSVDDAALPETASAAVRDPSVIDPAETFAGQLKLLKDMGFDDLDKCRRALSKSGGKLQQAIEWIVSDTIPEHGADEAPLAAVAPVSGPLRRALQQLHSMGFTDDAACIEALSHCGLDVDKAALLLVRNRDGEFNAIDVDPDAPPPTARRPSATPRGTDTARRPSAARSAAPSSSASLSSSSGTSLKLFKKKSAAATSPEPSVSPPPSHRSSLFGPTSSAAWALVDDDRTAPAAARATSPNVTARAISPNTAARRQPPHQQQQLQPPGRQAHFASLEDLQLSGLLPADLATVADPTAVAADPTASAVDPEAADVLLALSIHDAHAVATSKHSS
ncbi:hypothetical protein HK405_012634, partial [Cladochytrium tenue]